LIPVLTLVLAYKPLTQLLPMRFSSGFEKKKDAKALRVMTWNVEHFDILEHKTHPENKEKMLNLVNEYQPDIACFQEMVGSDTKPEAINYVQGMVPRMDFADYYFSYNTKLDFDGDHHFGIIIFSRYPIVHKQTVSFFPHDYNSIFQYVDILKGTDTLRVFNIHLQSLKFSADNLEYIDKPSVGEEGDMAKSKNVLSKLKRGFLKRRTQADRIREVISQSPYPVIVCGDFNDVPNSYAYHTIGKGLKNAFAEKGSGLGCTFSGISPDLRIDNIFSAPDFSVRQYTRVSKKLSDHFPVMADLELARP